MHIQLNPELEASANAIVHSGRFASVEAVVAEGMRLVEIREKKLASLRAEIQDALAEDEWVSWEDVNAGIETRLLELQAQGYE